MKDDWALVVGINDYPSIQRQVSRAEFCFTVSGARSLDVRQSR